MPKSLECSQREIAYVEGEINTLRSYYQEQFKTMHYIRRMRFMRLRGNAPRPFQRLMGRGLQSPFSYRLVQTATSMLGKERPKFTRIPLNTTSVAKESAARLQNAADPMLQELERVARRPLFWQFLDQALGDGRAVMKTVREVWTGFPQPRDGENEKDYNKRVGDFIMKANTHPIRSRLVDPMNFLVPPYEYEMPYAIEQGRRPLLAVLNKLEHGFGVNNNLEYNPNTLAHPVLELPRGINTSEDVEEFWTDEFCYIRIAGSKVLKFENEIGAIPYTHTMGEVSSLNDPALMSLSILYPYQGIEPWLNTLMTTMAAWSVIGGTPIMYTSRRPYQGAPPPGDMGLSEIPLGRRIDLGTGGEVGFVQPPPVGREVLEFMNTLVSFLDRAGITPLASGIMGNRTPGTAFSAAIEAATGKLKVVKDNVEFGIADWVKLCWKVVESIGKPINVTGVGLTQSIVGKRMQKARYTIDPKDIDGYYDLSCELTVSSLQDEISKGMHAVYMKTHGLWDRDRAMRFAGADDPREEWKGTIRDRIEDSPFVIGQIMQEAIKEDPELERRAAELQEQGVDVVGLLTGDQQAVEQMANGGGGGAVPPGSRPAPAGGGRGRGSPKRPGGNRNGTPQGSRGHR